MHKNNIVEANFGTEPSTQGQRSPHIATLPFNERATGDPDVIAGNLTIQPGLYPRNSCVLCLSLKHSSRWKHSKQSKHSRRW